jgi:hypothetical protein
MASERPSTSSVLWGEWRRGLKDLQNAVLSPFNGQVATHEEAGTIGNPTQAIVTNEIQGEQQSSYEQVRNSYAASAPAREPEQEDARERD